MRSVKATIPRFLEKEHFQQHSRTEPHLGATWEILQWGSQQGTAVPTPHLQKEPQILRGMRAGSRSLPSSYASAKEKQI